MSEFNPKAYHPVHNQAYIHRYMNRPTGHPYLYVNVGKPASVENIGSPDIPEPVVVKVEHLYAGNQFNPVISQIVLNYFKNNGGDLNLIYGYAKDGDGDELYHGLQPYQDAIDEFNSKKSQMDAEIESKAKELAKKEK